MNKDMLYTVNNDCRLCGETGRSHAGDCPGEIIESLRFSVQVTGSDCSRGCCGYTDKHVTGSTREEAIANALEEVGYNQRHSAYVRLVSDEETCTNEYRALADAQYEAKKRKEEDARLKGERDTRVISYGIALQNLVSQRGDLTPEAYTRRWEALENDFVDYIEEWCRSDAGNNTFWVRSLPKEQLQKAEAEMLSDAALLPYVTREARIVDIEQLFGPVRRFM